MDEKILQIFNANPDKHISGEQLSGQLGCSRTAIWKHIQSLRRQGYEFEAVPRLGYRMIQKPARLDIPVLMAGLQTKVMGRKVKYYQEVESTQTIAQQLVEDGAEEGTLIIAERQKSGRGRMGRKWHSPAGKGIWMSLVLTPRIPLHFTPQLTLLIAVALCRTLKKLVPVDIGIKWPNDLLIKGKKISGILLESSAEDERLRYVIAGIGISVNLKPGDYPEELNSIASSLFIESGSETPREEIISAFLHEFEQLYELFHEQGFDPIRTLWEALSVTLHKPISIPNGSGRIEGIAEGIDDMGALIIRQSDGNLVKLYSGDIETSAFTHCE